MFSSPPPVDHMVAHIKCICLARSYRIGAFLKFCGISWCTAELRNCHPQNKVSTNQIFLSRHKIRGTRFGRSNALDNLIFYFFILFFGYLHMFHFSTLGMVEDWLHNANSRNEGDVKCTTLRGLSISSYDVVMILIYIQLASCILTFLSKQLLPTMKVTLPTGKMFEGISP